MSYKRKFRRLSDKAKLTPVSLGANPLHGCDQCRSVEYRTILMKSLVDGGELCTVKAKCSACQSDWIVSLYSEPGDGEVRVSFVPHRPVLN